MLHLATRMPCHPPHSPSPTHTRYLRHRSRSLRYFANGCYWTLSDRGLRPFYGVFDKGRQVAAAEGPSVRCDTEEDVFRALGVPYRPPHERNCGEDAGLGDGSGGGEAAAGGQAEGEAAGGGEDDVGEDLLDFMEA